MAARKLKILADENIPGPVCSWLRGLRRVDFKTVQEVQLRRQEDPSVAEYARQDDRILLAGDKVFSERNYTVCTHPGIINVSQLNTKPHTCQQRLAHLMAKARRLLGHNVVHVHESDFCVVKVGNKKEVFRYE